MRTAAAIAIGLLTASPASAGSAEKQEAELRAIFGQEYVRPATVPFTEENPYSDAKRDLGHVLFFDQRLSKNGNQSCVSCHHPGLGWEMGIPKALGLQEMPRKSQTLYNLAWQSSWFWDGRADGYEKQFNMALASPKALGMSAEELEKRLRAATGYAPLFKKAFPDAKTGEEITAKNVAKAIEIYQRGIVSGPAPFDRWVAGDAAALSAGAKKGALVFAKKANCIACHSGWNFSDDGFHDVGLDDADLGRGKHVAGVESLQHAFKTPTLRSIAQRAPYMHDGSVATLEAVVDHYDKGGAVKRTSLAPEMKKLKLSNREKKALVEFLKSLTGEDAPVAFPQIPM